MVFTYVENFSYVKKSLKYIQLEQHDDQSLNNFIDELKSSNICEQLQDHVDSNPQDNYELFHRLLQNAKDKHLPKKPAWYDKKKHKSSKWITNGILKSINTKDRMYKKLELRSVIAKVMRFYNQSLILESISIIFTA